MLRGCKAVTGVETARCACAVSVRLRRCVESRPWSGGVEIDGSEARFYRIKQIPNKRVKPLRKNVKCKLPTGPPETLAQDV